MQNDNFARGGFTHSADERIVNKAAAPQGKHQQYGLILYYISERAIDVCGICGIYVYILAIYMCDGEVGIVRAVYHRTTNRST